MGKKWNVWCYHEDLWVTSTEPWTLGEASKLRDSLAKHAGYRDEEVVVLPEGVQPHGEPNH